MPTPQHLPLHDAGRRLRLQHRQRGRDPEATAAPWDGGWPKPQTPGARVAHAGKPACGASSGLFSLDLAWRPRLYAGRLSPASLPTLLPLLETTRRTRVESTGRPPSLTNRARRRKMLLILPAQPSDAAT